MNDREYENAFAIFDPAERAEALVHMMNEASPSPQLVRRMLADPYDVIRAEALDFLITNRTQLLESDLLFLAVDEKSPIVRGRARFYFALMDFHRALSIISEREFSDFSEYDKVWWSACDYVLQRDLGAFTELSSFLFSDSYDTTGTSLDILVEITTGFHRRLLVALLEILAEQAGISKINLSRVYEAIKTINSEPKQQIDLLKLRAELRSLRGQTA